MTKREEQLSQEIHVLRIQAGLLEAYWRRMAGRGSEENLWERLVRIESCLSRMERLLKEN